MVGQINKYVLLAVCALGLSFYGSCQIDAGFGDEGWFVYANGEYNTLVDLVVTQDDGVLLAIQSVESSTDFNPDFVLVKLTSQGVLDEGFGIGGIIKGDFVGYINSEPKNLQVFADGRFVLAGLANKGNDLNYAAVAHFNFDGSVDTTFETTGVSFYLPSKLKNLEYRFFNSDITPGVLVGSAMFIKDVEYNSFSAVTRLAKDWQIDSSFQETGTLLMDFVKGFSVGENSKVAHAEGGSVLTCLPLSNGSFILGGYYFLDAGLRVGYVCKIDSIGELDSTFATNGFININSPGSSESRVIEIQPNSDSSRYYVGVREITNPDNDFVVYKMSKSGEIEDTVIIDVKGASDNMQSVSVTDDFVVTAGYALKPENENVNFRVSDYWAVAFFDKGNVDQKKFWFQDDPLNAQRGIQRVVAINGNRVIAGGFQGGSSNAVRDILVSRIDLDLATAVKAKGSGDEWCFYPTIIERNEDLNFHPNVQSFRIYNSNGQLIGVDVSGNERIHMEFEKSGLYFIEVQKGKQTQRQKLVVNQK